MAYEALGKGRSNTDVPLLCFCRGIGHSHEDGNSIRSRLLNRSPRGHWLSVEPRMPMRTVLQEVERYAFPSFHSAGLCNDHRAPNGAREGRSSDGAAANDGDSRGATWQR